ncbi:MAG: TVP38/TMEM64 family protein [Clostridia bacterium]|nr:TVP38/TMEM64 family protein [Clostridia bacterium]
MQSEKSNKLKRKKRIIALLSLAVVLLLMVFLAYFVVVKFFSHAKSGEEFREFIQGYGGYGFLVAIALQIIQVFIALIPGEAVEIGLGYAFGWFNGTLLCLVGVAIGSALIFLLTKKFGLRLVELFVSTEKINELKFINTEEKMKRFTFIVFFIPGTPKDLLTYFVGLTRMSLGEFLTITMFARIPSVVSSTVGGNFIGDGKYVEAVVLFVITAIISLLGLKLYNIFIKKMKVKAKKGKEIIKNIKAKRIKLKNKN